MDWATPEDEAQAEHDAMLYGVVYAVRAPGKGGLIRIDPTTITVIERPRQDSNLQPRA